MKAHQLPFVSLSDYIQIEKETSTKHEYHNGNLVALAGGSVHHGMLCGNSYSELRNVLKGKTTCKAFTSEVKLYIESKNSFVYPDAMVICGEMERSTKEEQALTNPILIVEVLSKSTADYDRGDKFHLYRQIPSLQEYVLIEQDKAVVEIFYKHAHADLWQITRVEGLNQQLYLQSIDASIKMTDLYLDIELP